MKLVVRKTDKLKGGIEIPASKSHTIRAVILASLAKGTSKLINPLKSEDAMAAVNACKALGARIKLGKNEWTVKGFGKNPRTPKKKIDFANSGTSSRLMIGVMAALGINAVVDGDASLRTRPMSPLFDGLKQLGLKVKYLKKQGYLPAKITGRINGGKTTVNGKSSQYVSSPLIACPLCENDAEIKVVNMKEQPYIEMTLKCLDEQGIKYKRKGFTHFKIKGNQAYKPFKKQIPGDWSSATFPIAAAAVTSSNVLIKGVDIKDVQGDKEIINYLKRMGANIKTEKNAIKVIGKSLKGTSLDLNHTPDALPAMSVVGCFASGTTTLKNVAQARIKETDRIKVMTKELSKLGADVKELKDGMIIKQSKLKGTKVKGHHDHRIVMALSIAGLIADGKTEIDSAESVNVTFPGYVNLMKKLGCKMEVK
ncbi:3-phosphoshikimate 1-carboxyvinyltransferase [Candidatus Woesearchaeota archaeon]|nr:3-phosphoshikimate 1-carboxyvinyltransferase [Candidatus Woesearchaeota archaeon]